MKIESNRRVLTNFFPQADAKYLATYTSIWRTGKSTYSPSENNLEFN